MRILYYNWVDFLDHEKRGGGVTVYQKNLAEALEGRSDTDVTFISSGVSFDLKGGAPYWRETNHGKGSSSVPRYEIVNSGVIAPAHHSFGNPAQISHPATTQAFFDFVEAKGPFDVIHFNNLEGLPADVLEVKTRFPGTRVVFSLHNYYPVCPQVNLWFDETENCRDFEGGRRCTVCLEHQPYEPAIRKANAVAYELKKRGIVPGTKLFDIAWANVWRFGRKAMRVWRLIKRPQKSAAEIAADAEAKAAKTADGKPLPRKLTPKTHPEQFAERRAAFTRLVNDNCDLVLGVSDRVCDVAARFGISRDLLKTSYIGTKHAEIWEKSSPRDSITAADGTLTLAYMGYMRRDKGYFFLMRALQSLPDDLAGRVRLLVCARRGDDRAMTQLALLGAHLKEVLHMDGYTHDQLDELLAGVDVGVVPVLWEDNLPQVAIEMHARRIPLLTSDLGGARELANCPEMVFEAGSNQAFHDRIRAILDGTVDVDHYWSQASAPISMEAHLAELMTLYSA